VVAVTDSGGREQQRAPASFWGPLTTVEEIKRQYLDDEIDEEEMERKLDSLLEAQDG